MKQLKLKLPNVKYKFDVIIENDYIPSDIINTFEVLDDAKGYRQYLIDKDAVEPWRIKIQCGNNECT